MRLVNSRVTLIQSKHHSFAHGGQGLSGDPPTRSYLNISSLDSNYHTAVVGVFLSQFLQTYLAVSA